MKIEIIAIFSLEMFSQPAFTCSKLTIGVKYVQVNNKDTRTTPHLVSIVNYEHAIAGWVYF